MEKKTWCRDLGYCCRRRRQEHGERTGDGGPWLVAPTFGVLQARRVQALSARLVIVFLV